MPTPTMPKPTMVKDDPVRDHHDVIKLHEGLRRRLQERDQARGLEGVRELPGSRRRKRGVRHMVLKVCVSCRGAGGVRGSSEVGSHRGK